MGHMTAPDTHRPEGSLTPITPRAVLLGAFGVALLAAINPYLAYVRGTWEIGSGSLLSSAVLVLFVLVLLNGALVRWWPGRAFSRAELLVVYGMLIVSVGFVSTGGMPYLVSATTYPIYRATPSNGWEHLIWPHVPLWLRLNAPEAVAWFWEGLPEGVGIPWRSWWTPLLSWGSFTLALMAAMFCLGALLSKDWIERQRLAFPLVDIPLAITGDQPRPTLGTSLLNNRIFWIGFAIPAVLAVVNFLHRLYPSIPATEVFDIEVGRYFASKGLPWSVLSGQSGIKVSILFPVIGITCLLPSGVSLSLWLFYVLYWVQMLVWASFGVAEGGGTAAVSINPRSFIGFEEAGGFLALSAVVLYQSRNAFKAAWWSLLGRARSERDPYAPLAGRWALLGFLLTNGFMLWWAMRAGMSWWAFALLLGIFYTVLLGASRLVAAAGVMYVDTGFFPRMVALNTIGALPIGWPGLTMFSYLSVIYMYDPMNLPMPQMMNSFKLIHSGKARGRSFPWAAAIAVIVMLAVGLPAMLYTVHQHGATALPAWPFTSYPDWAFGELEASLHSPEPANNWLRAALVIGAGVMLGLVWLHTRFLWWPVSPIGFLIASSYETNRSLWVNVFIAWVVSGLIRRYGGLKLYRTMRPAFLGLVLGEFLTGGLLSIIASIFGLHQPIG